MTDLTHADLARFLADARLPVTLPADWTPAVHVVRAGEALVQTGEASDTAYVVYAGLFEVIVDAPRRHRVGWAGRGEWIGEVGVLNEAPRHATVIAWRDSLVIRFSADQTRRLLTADPARLPALTAHLLRLGAREVAPRPGAYVLAIAAPARMVPALRAVAAQPVDGVRWITAGDVHAPEPADRAHALARACEAPGLVVLLSGDDAPEWRAATLRNADRAAFVFHERDPAPTPPPGRPTDRLLVHDDDAQLSNLLATRAAPYLVRLDAPEDWQEYLRMVSDEHANPAGLRRFALFAGLDDATLSRIQAVIDWRFVRRGAQVITAGADPDGLFLVGLGRLQASVVSSDGARTILGDSPRGSIVGELSVLLGTPRAADVHAIRDSRVGFIRAADFEALRASAPSIGQQVSRVAARRARDAFEDHAHTPPGALLVARLDADPRTHAFADAFVAELRGGQGRRVALITRERVEHALGVAAIALRPGQPGYRRLLAWLNRISADHDALVFACDAGRDPWTWCCLRHVDRVLLVGRPQGDPGLTPLESRARAEPMTPPLDLVLLQPPGIDQAAGTAAWVAPRPGAPVHHVRADTSADLAAAARRIMGVARGIAFAGASSRAPGHVGMIAAFERLGLPIDAVSGSSSGGMPAVTVAMGLDAEAALTHLIDEGKRVLAKGRDLQPPYTALMSGRRLDEGLQVLCGDRDFEDQLVPCRFSAVDLRTSKLIYLDRGPIWRGLRASMSIPVLYPPVAMDDRLLVDGGLISYIPAPAILPWCADGLVAMSDVSDPTCWEQLSKMELYGTQVSGWQQLLDRMLPWREPSYRPNLGDVMFLSMIVSNALGENRVEYLTRHPAICHIFRAFRISGLFGATPEAVRTFSAAFADHAVEALTAHLTARADPALGG